MIKHNSIIDNNEKTKLIYYNDKSNITNKILTEYDQLKSTINKKFYCYKVSSKISYKEELENRSNCDKLLELKHKISLKSTLFKVCEHINLYTNQTEHISLIPGLIYQLNIDKAIKPYFLEAILKSSNCEQNNNLTIHMLQFYKYSVSSISKIKNDYISNNLFIKGGMFDFQCVVKSLSELLKQNTYINYIILDTKIDEKSLTIKEIELFLGVIYQLRAKFSNLGIININTRNIIKKRDIEKLLEDNFDNEEIVNMNYFDNDSLLFPGIHKVIDIFREGFRYVEV